MPCLIECHSHRVGDPAAEQLADAALPDLPRESGRLSPTIHNVVLEKPQSMAKTRRLASSGMTMSTARAIVSGITSSIAQQ